MPPTACRSEPSPTIRPVRRSVALAVLALAALIASSCSAEDSGGESGATTIAPTSATASALLTRLASESADAVFESHHVGEVEAGGDRSAYVYLGRAGGEAVAYVCDGERGEWFTGSVDDDGAGELASTRTDGAMSVTVADDGLRTAVVGGTFDGATTVALPLEDGEGQLVRLEATSANGGAGAAVGGIIVTAEGVRGVFATSIVDKRSNTLLIAKTPGTLRPPTRIPTTTTASGLTDGQSNTVIVGERTTTTTAPGLTDGQSNTVILGERTTGSTSSSADGSLAIVVADTDTSALTIKVGTPTDGTSTSTTTEPSDTTPPEATPSSACDTAVAVVDELVLALETTRATTQHRLERVQRRGVALAVRLETASDEERAAIELQIAGTERRSTRLGQQLSRIDEQIDALEAAVAPCLP